MNRSLMLAAMAAATLLFGAAEVRANDAERRERITDQPPAAKAARPARPRIATQKLMRPPWERTAGAKNGKNAPLASRSASPQHAP